MIRPAPPNTAPMPARTRGKLAFPVVGRAVSGVSVPAGVVLGVGVTPGTGCEVPGAGAVVSGTGTTLGGTVTGTEVTGGGTEGGVVGGTVVTGGRVVTGGGTLLDGGGTLLDGGGTLLDGGGTLDDGGGTLLGGADEGGTLLFGVLDGGVDEGGTLSSGVQWGLCSASWPWPSVQSGVTPCTGASPLPVAESTTATSTRTKPATI